LKQFPQGYPLEGAEALAVMVVKELLGILRAKALYHTSRIQRRTLHVKRLLSFANYGFSTDFHTRIFPLTPSPTPFYPSTSASIIRTGPCRSNDHAVHGNLLLTNGNYHGTIPYESKALSLSDGPAVSAPPLCLPRLDPQLPFFPHSFHSFAKK